jgi:uncharacterized cupredoxin-like copper-binding protein
VQSSSSTTLTIVSQPAATSLAPGASTTFQVKFTPSSTGLKPALLTINNNDSANSPFTFTIQGTGVVAAGPTIQVLGTNNAAITNHETAPITADGTDFGSVAVGAFKIETFTIKNTGGTTLTFTGGPIVQSSSTTTLTIVSQPTVTSLAPGASITFQVKFAPSSTGVKPAVLTINSNDTVNGSFTFTIRGTGI